MTLVALLTAALLNLEGLEQRHAGGVCSQIENILDQDPSGGKRGNIWDLCGRDEACDGALEDVQNIETLCEWD